MFRVGPRGFLDSYNSEPPSLDSLVIQEDIAEPELLWESDMRQLLWHERKIDAMRVGVAGGILTLPRSIVGKNDTCTFSPRD